VTTQKSLRRFGTNTAWLYGAETVPRFVSLFIIAVWSRRVTPESYGVWLIAQSTVELVLQTAQLGFASYLMKVLYRFRDRRANQYFGFGATTVMTVTTVTLAAVAAASGVLTRAVLGPNVRSDIFVWLAVYGLCAQFNNLAVQYSSSRVDYRSYFSLVIGRWAGNTSIMLLALLVFDQDFYSFVWAAVGSEVLLLPLAAYQMRGVCWRWRHPRIARFAWRFSVPHVATELFSWGEARIGRYLLAFAGLGAGVGLLGMAQTFSQVYGAAVRPAKIVAQRLVGHALEADADAEVYLEFFHLYSCLSLLCAFGLALFLGDVVRMFSADTYELAMVALPLLVFTLYFQEMYSLYDSLAFRHFKVWFHAWGMGIGFPVVAIGTVILIPWIGFVGVALAQLMGAIARAVYGHLFCARLSNRRFRIGEKFGFAGAAFGLSQFAVYYGSPFQVRLVMAVLFTALYFWIYWRRRNSLFPQAAEILGRVASVANAR